MLYYINHNVARRAAMISCQDENAEKILPKLLCNFQNTSEFSMLHGRETWPVSKENEVALQWQR